MRSPTHSYPYMPGFFKRWLLKIWPFSPERRSKPARYCDSFTLKTARKRKEKKRKRAEEETKTLHTHHFYIADSLCCALIQSPQPRSIVFKIPGIYNHVKITTILNDYYQMGHSCYHLGQKFPGNRTLTLV